MCQGGEDYLHQHKTRRAREIIYVRNDYQLSAHDKQLVIRWDSHSVIPYASACLSNTLCGSSNTRLFAQMLPKDKETEKKHPL